MMNVVGFCSGGIRCGRFCGGDGNGFIRDGEVLVGDIEVVVVLMMVVLIMLEGITSVAAV